ncbi:enoyl-CoA hydratase-related protein [Niveispirillum sp.]|uniref:enoyl-CoA hydratase/isomerase family protein n=1 Tax=Niveispirillum sp. TaxID=1917217 RepID=UPI001B53D5E0|nr:enoyl-CoA hydratase-related protein [Niveispirillum sp.]MBP7334287.1 enoyl-CoA hydratase/isomerase family protein [Niveispirillum sp.]
MCLDLKRTDAIAMITLARPDKGNAINIELADALLAAVTACEADAAIRAVVLTGAGALFCAGGDIDAFAQAGAEAPGLMQRLTGPVHAAQVRLARMRKPLVTAINGAAAGAGLGLAVMGDVAIAAASATFVGAYGAIGLSPDVGASWWLPRLIGLRQAQRLLLLGERIDAVEAERIGLVTRMVPDDQLMATAMAAAGRLAHASLPALQRTRALLLDAPLADLETHLDREVQALTACAGEPDAAEGIAAFREKRRPSFCA